MSDMMCQVSWEERFDSDIFLTKIVERKSVVDDQSLLAQFDESLPNIRQCIANSDFQLFSYDSNTDRITIVRFILKTKRGDVKSSQQNYLLLDGSVFEVEVLVRCGGDERVQPMFMEYDRKTNTLMSYLEASIRIQRKPDCEWGELRDGWRSFQFVVCKGPQPQPTKAAHTVHRFICLGYARHQEEEEEEEEERSTSCCCSPPLPQYNEMEPLLIDTIRQQQEGSSSSSSSCSPPLPQQKEEEEEEKERSHCCCSPPLPQYNEMEPLLIDTIRQLRKEKEDLLEVRQGLEGHRQHRDLLLAENLRLKEEKYALKSEIEQLKETQEHARNSSGCEPFNKRRKIDSSSSSSFSDFYDDFYDNFPSDEYIFEEDGEPNPF